MGKQGDTCSKGDYFQAVKTLFFCMASFYFKIKRIHKPEWESDPQLPRTVNLGCSYSDRSLGISESVSCLGLEA